MHLCLLILPSASVLLTAADRHCPTECHSKRTGRSEKRSKLVPSSTIHLPESSVVFYPLLFRGWELQLRLEGKLSSTLISQGTRGTRAFCLLQSWDLQTVIAWRRSPGKPVCELIRMLFLTSLKIGAAGCAVQMPRYSWPKVQIIACRSKHTISAFCFEGGRKHITTYVLMLL